MPKDFRIAVLLSGRGSNFKSLLDGAQHYTIVSVISNKVDALGATVAQATGIPTHRIPRADYPTLGEQKSAILAAVRNAAPALVVLAGFMQIIDA